MFNNDTQEPADPYETRKYRRHLSRETEDAYTLPGKSLLDVSRLSRAEMHSQDPHMKVSSACANYYGHDYYRLKEQTSINHDLPSLRDSAAEVYHYIGSRESFLSRSSDKRFSDRAAEYLSKVTRYGFGRVVGKGVVDENNDLRTWMDEFEREWEQGGMEKGGKNADVSFASLMNGLGVHNQRSTATATTTSTLADPPLLLSPPHNTTFLLSGPMQAAEARRLPQHGACSGVGDQNTCKGERKCRWDTLCNVCYDDD